MPDWLGSVAQSWQGQSWCVFKELGHGWSPLGKLHSPVGVGQQWHPVLTGMMWWVQTRAPQPKSKSDDKGGVVKINALPNSCLTVINTDRGDNSGPHPLLLCLSVTSGKHRRALNSQHTLASRIHLVFTLSLVLLLGDSGTPWTLSTLLVYLSVSSMVISKMELVMPSHCLLTNTPASAAFIPIVENTQRCHWKSRKVQTATVGNYCLALSWSRSTFWCYSVRAVLFLFYFERQISPHNGYESSIYWMTVAGRHSLSLVTYCL